MQGTPTRGRYRQHPLLLPAATDGSLHTVQRGSPTRGRQLRRRIRRPTPQLHPPSRRTICPSNRVGTPMPGITVADNEAKYSRHEATQAIEARQLQRRLANPPDAMLIKALTSGTIQNTAITPADISRATAIYGPSIRRSRGAPPLPTPFHSRKRTHHHCTHHYRAENVQIENILCANGQAFAITIAHPIGRITSHDSDLTTTQSLQEWSETRVISQLLRI